MRRSQSASSRDLDVDERVHKGNVFTQTIAQTIALHGTLRQHLISDHFGATHHPPWARPDGTLGRCWSDAGAVIVTQGVFVVHGVLLSDTQLCVAQGVLL